MPEEPPIPPLTPGAPPDAAALLDQLGAALPRAVLARAPDGRVLWLNAEAERLFGVARGEARVVPSLPVSRWLETLWLRCLQARGLVESDWRPASGGPWPVQARLLEDATGAPAGLLVMASDPEAGALERAARQGQSQFLRLTAHELKGQLTSILGAIEILAEDPSDPMAGELAEIVKDGAHQLHHMVESLFGLARRGGGRALVVRRPVPLASLIDEVLAGLRLPGRQMLERDLAPALPAVAIDRELIAEVLEELLGNALRFGPEDQRVRVSARPLDDREVQVEVADQGPGIPAERRADVLEPFVRLGDAARCEREGAGLGLAVAHQLVRLHDGRLWVDAAPAGGAIVAFTLPIDHQEPGP